METRQFNLSQYNYYLSDDKQSVVFVNSDDFLKKELQRLGIKLSSENNQISLEEFKRLRSVHLKQQFHDMFPGLEDAIDYVWENYLSHAFKEEDVFWKTDDNFMVVDRKDGTRIEVPRPNHGIVHTLRVAALIPILIAFYQLHASPDCQKMLDKYDARTIKFLQLTALFSVVGRLDETGFGTEVAGTEERYLEYRQASADAFEKYCQDNQAELEITDAEIAYYTFVVFKMGDPAEIEKSQELIRKNIESQLTSMKEGRPVEMPENNLFDFSILHLSHCLDLFRCADANRIQEVLKEYSYLFDPFLVGDYQIDLDEFIRHHIELIIITGDRLMSDYQGKEKFEDVKIPYNKEAYAETALNPKKAINVINQHLTQNPESALEDLLHGPRQKTQATQDLEIICNAFLSPDKKIMCTRNILGEVEINIDGEIFNLSQILKNGGDFEQVQLSKEKISSYAEFLAHQARYRPSMKGVAGQADFYPSEQDYKKRDPVGVFDNLSYSEKLAITLYSNNKMYEILNNFLRNDAIEKDSQTDYKLTENVKEMLLVAAVATEGLNKTKKVASLNQDYWLRRYLTIYRMEFPSDFYETRQTDMEAERPTLQKGFTSTSERLDIGFEHKQNLHVLKKIFLTIPQGDLPSGYQVGPLCWNADEEEVLLPPGVEVKYYKRIQYTQQDVMYGVPVRTIASEQEYAYGTESFRKKRRELLEIISAQLASPLVSSARVSMDEYAGISEDLFYQAIKSQKFDVAKWLFEHGVNPAPRAGDNYNDFILFCCQVDQADIIEKYWKYGERKSLIGNVILSEAILRGSKKVVERLLEKFPNELNLEESSLATSPLHAALRVQSEEVVRLLLAKGANIEVYGDANDTPLEYALDRVKENGWKWVELLIASGANATDRLVARAINDIMLQSRAGDDLFFNILTPKAIEKVEEYFKYTPRFAKPEHIQHFYTSIISSKKFDFLDVTIQVAILDAVTRLNKESVNTILHRLLVASLFKPVVYLLLKDDLVVRDFDKHNFAFYANGYPAELEDFMINAISAMPPEEAQRAIEKLRDPASTVGGLFSWLAAQPGTSSPLLFKEQPLLNIENILAKIADKQVALTKPRSPD